MKKSTKKNTFLQQATLILLSIIYSQIVHAQTINTWKGGLSGAWNSSSNWSRGSIPGSTDVVTFDGNNIDGLGGTGAITVTSIPTVATVIGQLVLVNSVAVSLQAASGGSATLTVGSANYAGDEISVPSGSTLILASNVSGVTSEILTIGLANVAGVTANIAGTLNILPNSTSTGSGALTYSNSTGYNTINQLVINKGQLYKVTTTGTSAAAGGGPGVVSGIATDGTVGFTYVGTLFGSNYATAYNNVYDAHYGVTTITGTVNYAGLFSNTSAYNASPNSLQFNGATFNNQRKDAAFPGNGGSTTTNAPSYSNVNVTISGVQYSSTLSVTANGTTGTSYSITIQQFPASINTLNFSCSNMTSGSLRPASYSDASSTLNAASLSINMGTGGAVMLPNISSKSVVNISGNLTVNTGTLNFGWSAAETVTVGGTFSMPSTGNVNANTTALDSLTVNNFSLTGIGAYSLLNSGTTHVVTVTGDFTKSSGTFSTNTLLKVRFAGSAAQTVINNGFGTPANVTVDIANTGSAGNNTVGLSTNAFTCANIILTSGVLASSSNSYLTLTGTLTGGSSSTYIIGPIYYTSASTSAFTLPLGYSTIYSPITITPTSATSTIFQVQYSPIGTIGNLNSPLLSINNLASYAITLSTGTINATVSFPYNFINGVVNSTANLVLAKYTSSAWSEVSATPTVSGNTTIGNISDATAIGFSTTATNVTIGSINALTNCFSVSTYLWNGITTDYQVATNWTPTRTLVSATDILQFNSNATVTNLPTQTIGQLKLTGTASVSLQATSGGSSALTVGSINNSGDEISVPVGCTLTLATNASGGTSETLTLGLANISAVTANIAGTLTILPNSIITPISPVVYANNNAYTLNQYVTNRGELYQVTTVGTASSSGSGPGNISGAAADGNGGTQVFTYVGTLFGSNYATAYNNVYDAHYGVTTITGTVNYAGKFNNTSLLAANPNTLQFMSGSTFNNQRYDAAFPGSGSGTNAPSYTSVNVTISGVQYISVSQYISYFPASINTLNFNCNNMTGGSIRPQSLSDGTSTLNLASVNINLGSGGSVMLPTMSSASKLNVSGNLTVNTGQLNFGWSGAENVSVGGTLSMPSTGSIGANTNSLDSLFVNNFSLTGSGSYSTINSVTTHVITVFGNYTKTAGTFNAYTLVNLRFAGSSAQTFTTINAFNHPENVTIEIANTGSAGKNTVTLGNDFIHSGLLKLTSGVLVSSTSNSFTLAGGFSGGNNNSYVSGPIYYTSAATTPFVLPTGGNSQYLPITITPSSAGSTTFQVAYNSNSSSTPIAGVNSPLRSIYNLGNYTVSISNGVMNATVSFLYNFTSGVVANTSNIVMATLNNSWSEISATPTISGNTTTGTITDLVSFSTAQQGLTVGSINSSSYLYSLPTYIWSGGASGNFQTASNWTPARTTPLSTDLIQFNSSATVSNVSSQTIGQLTLGNNATVLLQAQTGSTSSLTVSGGLVIPIGCTLFLNMGQAATDAMVVNLTNTSTAIIAGTLIIDSTFTNVYNNNLDPNNASVSVTGHIYRYGPPISFYVDPVNGNDANIGSLANPFATIIRARDTLRNMVLTMGSNINVYLRKGNYVLDSTLNFTNSDGGYNGYNVVYQAYNNEKPVVTGGTQITGWTKVGGQNYYVANVPTSAGFANNYRYIWVNGRRARQAKGDFITVFPKPYTLPGSPYIGAGDGYIVKTADIKNYSNIADMRIFQQGVFKHIEMPVAGFNPINDSESIILMGQSLFSNWTARYLYHPQKQIQVWNAFEELDEPGEFYLNRTTGQVYYYPQPGENMSTASVVAPTVDTLVFVAGQNNANVQNLQFQGIAFEYGNWNGYLTKTIGFSQADLYSDYSSIEGQMILKYANNISIKNCRFEHLSSAGIYLPSNDSNIVIEGNVFRDLTAAAVIVGQNAGDSFNANICTNITVDNNVIRAIGADFYQASGIYANVTKNLSILHNDVADVVYFGINQRYNPDSLHNISNPLYSGNTNILYNKVTDFGTGGKYGFGMGDIVSGVYMYGVQSSNVKYNYVSAGGKNDLLETMIYQDGGNGLNNTWKSNVAECGNSNSSSFGQTVSSNYPSSWLATNVFDSNYANVTTYSGMHATVTNSPPWSGNALNIINNSGLQSNFSYLLNEFGNGTNIASQASVKSSSDSNTSYKASFINDGRLGTSWRPKAGVGAYLQLAFPNPIAIQKLQLTPDSNYNNPEARRLFEVWVSNDSTFATYNILGGQGSQPFAFYQSQIVIYSSKKIPIAPNTYDLYGMDTLGYKYIRIYGRSIGFSECRIYGRNQSVLPSSYTSNSTLSFTPFTAAVVEPVNYNWSQRVWDTINSSRVYLGSNTKYWQSYNTIADTNGVISLANYSGLPTCFNGAIFSDEPINFKLKLYAGKNNNYKTVYFRMPFEYYTLPTPYAYTLNFKSSTLILNRQSPFGPTYTLFNSNSSQISTIASLYNAMTPISIITKTQANGLAISVTIGGTTVINLVDTISGYFTQPGYLAFVPGSDSTDLMQITDIPVTGVTLTPSTVALHPNDTTTLVATTIPSNATIQNIYWSSSDTTVATVNSLGFVTAIGYGTATITATTDDSSKVATSTVNVVGYTWSGATNTNWSTASNWQNSKLPSAGSNIIIPSGLTNYPLLNGTTVVGNCSAQTGATLNLNNDTLVINDTLSGLGNLVGSPQSNLIMTGKGTLYLSQSVPGTSNALKSLTVNTTDTVFLGNTLMVNNIVKSVAGVLSSNGNLTLVSNASGTARIPLIGGKILGNVTEQLYIPAKSARKYSFIGSPVAQIIRNGWQQQIYITGNGTGGATCGITLGDGQSSTDRYNSNGFDVTPTSGPSMFTYNAVPIKGSRWVSIPNTNFTQVSPGIGYSVNIRGDRNTGSCTNQLNSSSPLSPVSVVLSATGALTQGNLTVALNDTSKHLFTLLANPYPNQIRFSAFKASNPSITNNMWTYSPYASNGNYTTFSNGIVTNAAMGFNNSKADFIAIGQAFFVQANKTGYSVTFNETHKIDSTIPNFNYFGNNAESNIRVGLYSINNNLLDEIVVRYSANGSKFYNPSWDAVSFNSGNQVLTSIKDTVDLAIATHPLPTVIDTIPLYVSSNGIGTFQLKLSDEVVLNGNYKVILNDKFLNQKQEMKLDSSYPFTITGDTNSLGKKRFELLVSISQLLPIAFADLIVESKNGMALIKWKVTNSKEIILYVVEKSTDGKNFYSIAYQKSSGNKVYQATDENQINGISYYRIKAISLTDAIIYSKIVSLRSSNDIITYSLSPNPAKDFFKISGDNINKVEIINGTGKVVKTTLFNSVNNPIISKHGLNSGVYSVSITNGIGEVEVKKIVFISY